MENIIKYNLAKVFSKAEIWTEPVEEGFSRPAFFIQCLEGGYAQEIGNRWLYTASYCIHYFTNCSKHDINKRLKYMAVKLWSILRLISYEGEVFHAYDTHHRTEDGVLQFFVSYRGYITVPPNTEKIKMKKINYKIESEE